MFFDHKKKLILSAVLLIFMFELDVVKGCSGGSSDEATTKAPYATTTTTSTNVSTGMYNATTTTTSTNVSTAYNYTVMDKTWTDDQCAQLTCEKCKLNDGKMMMPAGGLEECKKVCNGKMECYAFEYSDEGDCCVFREMCDPKEPTLSDATHHGGTYKDYKGYVKVSSTMSTPST